MPSRLEILSITTLLVAASCSASVYAGEPTVDADFLQVVGLCEKAQLNHIDIHTAGWEKISESTATDDQHFMKSERLLTFGSLMSEEANSKRAPYCLIELKGEDPVSSTDVADLLTSRFGDPADSWIENGEQMFSWFSPSHAYTVGPPVEGDGHTLIITRDSE